MLSPDEKILYITNGPVVVAFDVQPDGTVRNQRDFAKLEAGGAGDGMAIDAAGRLYVTSQPGVQVFIADGKYLGLIPTPRAVISVAFSGPGKRTLYVIGAGALGPDGAEFATPPGRPEQRQVDLQDPDARAGLHRPRKVTCRSA